MRAVSGLQVTASEELGFLSGVAGVRSRIYGHRFNDNSLHDVIHDIVDGHYCDILISAWISACAAWPLDRSEMLSLTRAMVSGDRLSWNVDVVADKHSAGGLPGNRTTPIVVSIAAALGHTIFGHDQK